MLAYAEIHYRPRFVPSLLYAASPEIIFDSPVRIAPGQPVPLFLIIKDAHRFPVMLESVNVRMIYANGVDRVASFPYNGEMIDAPIWWDAINIMPEYDGNITIDPYVVIMKGTRLDIVHGDNYRGSTLEPLKVCAASETIIPDGWYPGDVHCHSYYTSDQVEFGAPLEMLALAAKRMGLSWLAVTDHSYDLDDCEDDYLSEDPELPKWNALRRDSSDPAFEITIIPGEEVTCRNAEGRNCHLLALNSSRFLQGSGDSGEHGLKNTSELSIGEAAAACVEGGGIACAAHPLERISWPEQAVLNRGGWSVPDLETPGVTAMQVFNGEHDRGFHDGLALWVRFLLEGRKVILLGGSDSHGDMNRQRYIAIPFVSLRERHIHRFGDTRTVVKANSSARDDILTGIEEGRSLISEGPFIELTATEGSRSESIGGMIHGGTVTVNATFMSAPEYGFLRKVWVYAGNTGDQNEQILHAPQVMENSYRYQYVFDAELFHTGYLRAACVTGFDRYCVTNPIWISEQ